MLIIHYTVSLWIVSLRVCVCVCVCVCVLISSSVSLGDCWKMGQTQSTLMKSGYKIEKESESHAVVTKDGEKFCIRKIQVSELSGHEHDQVGPYSSYTKTDFSFKWMKNRVNTLNLIFLSCVRYDKMRCSFIDPPWEDVTCKVAAQGWNK